MVAKPSNAHKSMKVYYEHSIYLLHVSAIRVAILSVVRY
jgi:hypothetical protein